MCRIGRTHEEFITEIEKALENPRPKTEISEAIRAESWEARIDELRKIIARNES
jgi:hypothetical protein